MLRYSETSNTGNLLLCIGLFGWGNRGGSCHCWNRGGGPAVIERWGNCQDIQHWNERENVQGPLCHLLISCQHLPLAVPSEKVLGGAVHGHQHPRTEQSHKDGEWVRGQPANQQFHILGTSLQNRCTIGTKCIQKDMHEDVLFSTVYISKTSCSLGRKLCRSEEEGATSFNVNGSQRQPYSISVVSESS